MRGIVIMQKNAESRIKYVSKIEQQGNEKYHKNKQ